MYHVRRTSAYAAAQPCPIDGSIVAPTSRSAQAASFRPEIAVNGQATRVLVEQIGTVDSQRLGALSGHLTPEELWSVDEALLTVLGLS